MLMVLSLQVDGMAGSGSAVSLLHGGIVLGRALLFHRHASGGGSIDSVNERRRAGRLNFGSFGRSRLLRLAGGGGWKSHLSV
jgi:hypothetical protein